MTGLAVLLAAGAVALLFAGPTPGRRRSRRPRVSLFPVVALIGVGAVTVLDGTELVVGLIAAGTAAGVFGLVAQARQRRLADRRAEGLVEACEALVGELRAGQPLVRALERTVEVWPELEAVAAAERMSADVPDALRSLARRPGAEGLVPVAAAWQLCQSSGTGLALALERVLMATRSRQATQRLVRAELASARATARMIALLPLGALAASHGLGAEPWEFLLRTVPGLGCLGVGLALGLLGLWWVERIAAGVLREVAT